MNVLLVGNGGREHALAWKLSQSPALAKLVIAPGNPGTAELGHNVAVAADDVAGLVALARREAIELVVVGPEVALAAGLADALQQAGIPCFGPSRAAARIESSKAWSKQFMQRVGVPTCPFKVFERAADALAFVEQESWEQWRVVKLDGLAAGKGVVVATSKSELHDAIRSLPVGGQKVILEAPLTGEEVSLLAFCDGTRAVPLLPAQDHKRRDDGDRGPNTGGMGAYAPLPQIEPWFVAEIQRRVFEPTLRAMAAEGTPFVGVLYAGIMLTGEGPQVLEFNARFGDPETQVLLPLLDADLLEIMLACVTGRLHPSMVRFAPGAALGVVLAAEHYPAQPRVGDAISIPALPQEVLVFQAGTGRRDGQLVTAGGRVLTVVGQGPSLQEARERAYSAADRIQFAGKQLRRDIGWRAFEQRNGA